MFKNDSEKTPKGEATREQILRSALKLFREQGFAQTTMRDIAAAAGKSLGAAYHYFPSKDSIVAGYYAWTQDEHERRLEEDVDGPLASRLERAIAAKIDIVRNDRKIMAAQFASLGDPEHPLALFGPETEELRRRSVALFDRVFADSGLTGELRTLAVYSAWLVHLGVLMYFVYDDSDNHERTRTLVSGAAEMYGVLVPLAGTPMAMPLVKRCISFAHKLGIPGV